MLITGGDALLGTAGAIGAPGNGLGGKGGPPGTNPPRCWKNGNAWDMAGGTADDVVEGASPTVVGAAVRWSLEVRVPIMKGSVMGPPMPFWVGSNTGAWATRPP